MGKYGGKPDWTEKEWDSMSAKAKALVDLPGMQHYKIAEILGCSTSTVSKMINGYRPKAFKKEK